MKNRVLRKIKKMWPDVDPQGILDILNAYGTERYETGCERVQLGILKLSEGNREKLPELVRIAKIDWRDILAYAEYPEAIRMPHAKMRNLPPEEAKALRRRDKRQYDNWLKK